jgi:hypothetical protein
MRDQLPGTPFWRVAGNTAKTVSRAKTRGPVVRFASITLVRIRQPFPQWLLVRSVLAKSCSDESLNPLCSAGAMDKRVQNIHRCSSVAVMPGELARNRPDFHCMYMRVTYGGTGSVACSFDDGASFRDCTCSGF